MKLIEKLAEGFQINHPTGGWDNAAAEDGFIAGFRAAREIAIREAKQVDEFGLPCVNMVTIMERIGEEEIV